MVKLAGIVSAAQATLSFGVGRSFPVGRSVPAPNVSPFCIHSYFYEDERGLFPEVQFMFDLEVPEDFTPNNSDGEVDGFELYPIEEVSLVVCTDHSPLSQFFCAQRKSATDEARVMGSPSSTVHPQTLPSHWSALPAP